MEINVVEIERLTGYKAPLSLLDKVIELQEDESIAALANINMNEAFFKGHFPENPVMPGVLIIQAMVEAIRVLNNKEKILKKFIKHVFAKW